MALTLLKKLFGTSNDRYVKKLRKIVQEVNSHEEHMRALSDEALQQCTHDFKERLSQGASLNSILPEAFACVREASSRVLDMRHFDVQIMGGVVMHRGLICEMKTGEGKTLVATLPAYLNALTGKGVHVVTVNDYLASRDSMWMGKLYNFLGLSVGCITNDIDDDDRKKAYQADITYGTNNEFGFDFLRDNMKFRLDEMVQRPFNFAIIDEVDSILIDEARTPLIISGPAEDSSALYVQVNELVKDLAQDDYEKDEKQNHVALTEKGVTTIESRLKTAGLLKGENLYDMQNISLVHHANQALRAHTMFTKDKDYIVKDNKVIIIDEFTGRMMDGRRYSDGLHQALEAKENVAIQLENQTLASITFQNYFRMYPKLSGMSGTAMTEIQEFGDIYSLGVMELPTNKPCIRKDHNDEVYRTEREKNQAVIKLIQECQSRSQPVLVGTASIEKSEQLSQLLTKEKIVHQVLNARYHDKEASIIAEAGRPGRVTIATNMAGRGTDIKLGGTLEARMAEKKGMTVAAIEKAITEDAQKALDAGGLFVIGTERHESRRIDNQLRGRTGRQGDKGGSKFFLSLEDDLMRIFGSERLDSMLKRLGLKDNEAITHPWINRAIEKAQGRVEARNYDIRKHLLKYDNVMNDQRNVVYDMRKDLMEEKDESPLVQEMREEIIMDLVARHIPEKSLSDQWDIKGLTEECRRVFGASFDINSWSREEGIAEREIQNRLMQETDKLFTEKFSSHDPEVVNLIYRSILLRVLDQEWKDHLLSLDHLRQGINLRAYAQKDPLNEYKREAFELFEGMLDRVRENVISVLSHFVFNENIEADDIPEPETPTIMHEGREDPALQAKQESAAPQRARKAAEVVNPADQSTWGRVKRNDPCPCQSGKKYKHCHGKI